MDFKFKKQLMAISLISCLFAVSQVSQADSILLDAGFESPNLGAPLFNYSYNTQGTAWTFTGATGITGNFSLFTFSNSIAPEGVQVAFLQQGNGTTGTGSSYFSQTFNVLTAENVSFSSHLQNYRADNAVSYT